jgi:alpha-mannosidase
MSHLSSSVPAQAAGARPVSFPPPVSSRDRVNGTQQSTAGIDEILLMHHSHTDIGFTHPQPILWELQRRFIDRALDLLDETEDWPADSRPIWTCETTAPVMHWLRHTTDRQVERFRAHAARGRLSIGAMLYHFAPLASADEWARSLQPVRELRETFGIPIKAAIMHDVNGLPWPVAQLLLDAGIEMLLTGINIHFGGYPLTRPMAFNWESSDGRSLLTFNGEHYQLFDRICKLATNDLQEMQSGLAGYIERLLEQNYPHKFAFLTATHHSFCDNNPPNAATARLIRRWNEEQRTPRIRYVTPEGLLERLKTLPDVPSHPGEWSDYWCFGVQHAARETRVSRETRNRLAAAELLVHASRTAEPEVAERLEEAWQNILLFDEHTFGSCVCVEQPHFDDTATQWHLKAAYAYQARSLALLQLRDELDVLAGNPVEASGLEGVLVVNPSGRDREVIFRIPKEWLERKWDHLSSSVSFIELTREKLKCGFRLMVIASCRSKNSLQRPPGK